MDDRDIIITLLNHKYDFDDVTDLRIVIKPQNPWNKLLAYRCDCCQQKVNTIEVYAVKKCWCNKESHIEERVHIEKELCLNCHRFIVFPVGGM